MSKKPHNYCLVTICLKLIFGGLRQRNSPQDSISMTSGRNVAIVICNKSLLKPMLDRLISVSFFLFVCNATDLDHTADVQ